MVEKNYKNLKISKSGNSEIEIKVEINEAILSKFWAEVLKKLVKTAEIPGFRKGQAPEKMITERVGEEHIWHEAVDEILKKIYPEIIFEEKIKAIGRPEITLLKSVPKTQLEIKIKTAIFPEVKLAAYENIAKKKDKIKESEIKVTAEEVEKVTEVIRSERKTDKGELPKLNEEFIKSLGDFKNIEDFKEKIKANLRQEKVFKEKGKRRMAIIDEVIENSHIELPDVLVQGELDRMIAEFKGEIESSGLNFNDYLSKSKMTEEKLREEWRPKAEKRAKTQLILNKIAEEQKINPDQNLVLEEVEKIMRNYPGADRERAAIFVETVVANDAVFEFLEKLGDKSEN